MAAAKIDFPVDLVYLWVDGNDPKFIQEKQYWLEKLGLKHNEDNDKTRFIENQELRYSLRSVMKNAPWINKIFIITNGQIPSWLDLEKTDKIKIIRHDEIMPKEVLPCYNSRVIESYVANIPGLAEHFLLANDDCFIHRPVTPNFFFNKNGKPIIRFLRANFSFKKLKGSLYSRSIFYTHKLFKEKYGEFNLYVPHHNIDAYLKSAYIETINEFQKEFDILRTHRFRQKSIQRIAFALYLAYAKQAQIRLFKNTCKGSHHKETVFIDISQVKKMQKIIIKKRPQLLCINDASFVKEANRNEVAPFLESLYSNKQIWEKDNTIYANQDAVIKYKIQYANTVKAMKYGKIIQILQNIFSIKNDKRKAHKNLVILGIKIKFKKNKGKNDEQN